VKAVSTGSNTVAYLQDGQVAYGTVDASGNIKPIPGKARNPIVALGAAALAAVAGYLMGQVDDPNQKALISKQVMAPLKGAGNLPGADVTALGLKPGQTYYSNGQQYNIYTGKDGNVTVGVMPCKGKCKDNVNVKQATTLRTVANPWASVGNAPAPGVTKEDMKPGTVYTAKDGKTYQVTKDGKGFEQCSSRTELRSLEYRGIGSMISKVCGGRPRPANDLVNQAIQNAPQIAGTMNYAQMTANEYILGNQYATYGQYQIWAQSTGNQMISETQFNQFREQNNLPPTYHEVIPPGHPNNPTSSNHPSLLETSTQNYIQQNPNASYNDYKKKYGASAMSLEDYNKTRQNMGVPPVYQSYFEQGPMTVNQIRASNYPIYNFISDLYPLTNQQNTELSAPVQNSLNSIQTWLQANPAPLQQSQGIREYIRNFMTNNISDIGTLLNGRSNSNRARISSMLSNYIIETHPDGVDSYWANNPQVIRTLVQRAYNSIYPPSSTHMSINEMYTRQFL
jgi:hypothetical protein